METILNNGITQVLDNLGNVMLNNLEGVIGQALSNVSDISNNQITAGFEYSLEIPSNLQQLSNNTSSNTSDDTSNNISENTNE